MACWFWPRAEPQQPLIQEQSRSHGRITTAQPSAGQRPPPLPQMFSAQRIKLENQLQVSESVPVHANICALYHKWLGGVAALRRLSTRALSVSPVVLV